MTDYLARDVARLKVRLRAAEAAAPLSKQSRNPLPRPPEPISTDHIPSFEQALSESGGMSTRFPELPLSPYSNHSSELSDRNGRGHARSDNQSFMTAPSTPSSRYVDPHISDSQQRPNGHHLSRPTSSQVQYESNKPINSYALTAQYVQSYYDGLVDGHQVAHKINQLAQAEGSSSSEQAQALPSPPNTVPNYTISQDYQPSIRDDASSSHRGSVYSSSSDRSSIRSVDQRYSTGGHSSRSRRNSPRRSSGSSTTSSSRSDEQESTAVALAQHYSNPTLNNASSGSGSTTSRERSVPVSPQSHTNSIRSSRRNYNDNSVHPSTRPQTPYTTATSSPSALGLEDVQVSMAHTGPTDNGPTSTINNFTQTHAHRNSIVSGVSASSWGTFQTVMSGISDGSLGLGLHVPHSFTLPISLDESEQERLERLLQQQRHPTQPLQQHQEEEEEEEEEDEEEEDAVSFVSMPPSLRSEAGAVPPDNGMHSPVRPVHSMVGVLPGEADENSRHTTSHRGRDDPSAYDAHHSQYSQSRSYATTSSARSPTHQEGGRTHSHRSSRSQHQAPTSSSSNRNSTYSTSTSSSLRSYYTANGEFSQGPEQQQQQQGQQGQPSSSSNYYEPPRIRRTYANLTLPDTSPFGSHNGYALYPSDNATYYDHRYNGSSSSSVHSRVSSPRYGTSGVGAEQGASDGGGRSSSAMRNNALGLANI
ncbi:hypothetical protein D9613_010684 [Agrocybe pediades]|uniref:Uncharacterized protein n=1 Tax=Agrocybe pediades TaxID=84607 RepID=A0A8H4QFR1_9AGAR|nr:hypothetical protein D9613_010684 [Agrocybe pediades]